MHVIELLIFRFHSRKLTARHLTTFTERNFEIIQNLLMLIMTKCIVFEMFMKTLQYL